MKGFVFLICLLLIGLMACATTTTNPQALGLFQARENQHNVNKNLFCTGLSYYQKESLHKWHSYTSIYIGK